MSKVYNHPNGAFSLTLPDDWDDSQQKSTIAFFQPLTGVGAINVSVMVPTKDTLDPEAIVLEFTPKSIRAGLQPVSLPSAVPGAYLEYECMGDAWRIWVYCGRTRVVVLSYNCQVSYKGVEDHIVNKIIQSLVIG